MYTNLRSIVVDGYLHGEGVPHSQASAALPLRLLSFHEANGDQLQQRFPAQNLLVSCSMKIKQITGMLYKMYTSNTVEPLYSGHH